MRTLPIPDVVFQEISHERQIYEKNKEIITVDVYGDNSNLIAEPIPELEKFIEEVLPERREEKLNEELLNIEIDVSSYLP